MENRLATPPGFDRSEEESSNGSFLGLLIETTAFWTAVIIPFIYLPVFALDELIPMKGLVFVSLIGINILALLAGHGYDPTA